MHLRYAFLILAIWATSTLNAEIRVSTRFEPARVAAGSTARHIVEIVETDSSTMPSPQRITSLPNPSNGGFTRRNTRTFSAQSTQITNGYRNYSSTQQLIFDAVTSKAGSFTIPSYTFEYKGERLQAPAATLTVIERSADAAPTVDELIFLKTDAPEQLYVGQTTPITLKLYISSNVQLRGRPSYGRTADGFTVSSLPEEFNQSVEMFNGRRYRVYSCPLTITPISAGPQDISFQYTLAAQMPDQRNTRNSPFGSSSVFDNFFGRTERFNIYTEPKQIQVLTLPTKGRPKSFSGAIGMFKMQVTTDSDSTRVDEPIMLSLKLSGQGNFDRIKSPALPKARGWRNYQPESTFEGDDSQPLKGVKRFDYVFIPEKSGALKLPAVSFSFFDPKVEKYVELTRPALSIKVAPSLRPAMPTQPIATNTDDSAPAIDLTKALSPDELLLTLDYRPSTGRTIETNLLSSSWFYRLNSAGLLALTISSIWIVRLKKQRQSDDYALISEAKQALKATLKASQSSDAATFYRCAQEAIRLATTARVKRNLRSADIAELEAIFKQCNLADDSIEQARTLFTAADNHRFSGRSDSADLQSARTQLNTILKAL